LAIHQTRAKNRLKTPKKQILISDLMNELFSRIKNKQQIVFDIRLDSIDDDTFKA